MVSRHKAEAFSVSVAITFILSSPVSIGFPEKVLVPGLKLNHEGKGFPLINAAE